MIKDSRGRSRAEEVLNSLCLPHVKSEGVAWPDIKNNFHVC
jgi:hypothetical protein